MTNSDRDIEKLKAIGCQPLMKLGDGTFVTSPFDSAAFDGPAWEQLKNWTQSPEGMKATMADKVRFLSNCRIIELSNGKWLTIVGPDEEPEFQSMELESPEAATDHLFWMVS